MIIQIKHRHSGQVLFEYDIDNNTTKATLAKAIAQGADLQGADLQGAYLRNADLRNAYLRNAYLQDADLRNADLRNADLRNADLRGANLTEQKLLIASTRIIPPIGQEIIGYKKCCNGIIVKLLIPREAKRSHAFGRKCRAEYATVLEIDGAEIAYSQYNNNFSYKVGETIKPTEPFDDDFTQECAPGIHFFTSKEEALDY